VPPQHVIRHRPRGGRSGRAGDEILINVSRWPGAALDRGLQERQLWRISCRAHRMRVRPVQESGHRRRVDEGQCARHHPAGQPDLAITTRSRCPSARDPRATLARRENHTVESAQPGPRRIRFVKPPPVWSRFTSPSPKCQVVWHRSAVGRDVSGNTLVSDSGVQGIPVRLPACARVLDRCRPNLRMHLSARAI